MDELLAQSLAMEDYSALLSTQSTSEFPPSSSTSSTPNPNHNHRGHFHSLSKSSHSDSTAPTNPSPLPVVPNPPSLPSVLRRYIDQQSVINLSDDLTAVNPDVFMLFQKYNILFFDGKLSGCELKWSKRMTLCAGLCCYEGRGGLCSIKLSQPLLQYRSTKETIETLIHEMIHAFLFVTVRDRDRDGHGPSFQSLMNTVNYVSSLNISIYHTFHDEVDEHRKHVWKCNGRCQSKPPYFGVVKRAMNRPPGPNDSWYSRHQQQCGGEWTKISEPKAFTEKQRKKREREERRKQREKEKLEKAAGKEVTSKTGKANKARNARKSKNSKKSKEEKESKGNGRTLLDMFGGNGKAMEAAPAKKRVKVEEEKADDSGDDIEILDCSTTKATATKGMGNGRRAMERVLCPVCGTMVVGDKINAHIDACLS